MVLENNQYNIMITVDETYTVDSADNQHYDMILNPENRKQNSLSKTFSIAISSLLGNIRIALIGDFYSFDSDCALLEDHILTVLQNDSITQIDVSNGTFLLHKKFECFGCNFGIFKISAGYIIYGELEITMLDFQFEKQWVFSGRDIFVSQTVEKSFEISKQVIKLNDWEGNYYEINFDGKQIN